MHLGMEVLGAYIQKVLEMVMFKHDSPTKSNGTEDSSSSGKVKSCPKSKGG